MKSLMDKKAIINMKCPNEDSFKWAVTRSLNPSIKDPGRVTKILKQQTKQYNWEGIDFPTPLEQVKTFEKNNNLLVNVFGVDEDGDIRLLKVPTGMHMSRVLLLFVNNRYTVVKTFSRLISKQNSKGKRKCKRYHCYNCLESFTNKNKFDEHISCLCEVIGEATPDLCDLCSKRGKSLCPLHMDLERLAGDELLLIKDMRYQMVNSKRTQTQDFVVEHDVDLYKAVLKEGVWFLSYLGEKRGIIRRMCIACHSGFCLNHMLFL